uniref:CSON009970 protein n=1 Tax=Culicoides sonorensis TaxID=179676 RepID=A0A336LK82_CULSO
MCERNNFVLPSNQPIAELECKSAFRALTEQEKLYAHYFSKECILTSPESPLIFSLLHRILAKNSPDELEELAIKAGISQDDFTAFLVYCCGFFSNMGNYKGFDQELLRKYKGPAFELQVGLHELFGHGTGKLFRRNEDNTFNFDKNTVVNPLNNEKINQWYEPGETFDLKFKALASTYEEARAEAVGLYLSLNKEISKIFGHLDETIIEDLIYVNWLSLIQKGVVALEFYNPQHKNWLQAHAQARFVIMKVLVEAGEDLLSVEETVSNENLLIKLDRSKIFSVGKRAIKEFLLKLQVYKSMGDIEKASKFYNYYATVNEDGPQPWLRWREIVLKHKQPRIIFVQANTQIGKDNTVELLTYEPTLKGFLHSWKNRFPDTKVDDILENLWTADKHYFAKH